jgi:hypothetical protein
VLNNVRNGPLTAIVAETLLFCVEKDIEVCRSLWIPGTEMLYNGVDGLSRWKDVGDFTLREEVWMKLFRWEPKMEVDRFADRLNHKLPRWCSWKKQLGAEATDAMCQDWRGALNYAFPPLKLVPKVFDHVWRQRAPTVLVVPKWTGTWWYSVLESLTEPQDWLELGPSSKILQIGPSGYDRILGKRWNFIAVKLFWRS